MAQVIIPGRVEDKCELELEDKGDLNTGECLKGDCLRGEWGIGERKGLLGEVKPEVESVVSRSSLASCQHRGTPNLLK